MISNQRHHKEGGHGDRRHQAAYLLNVWRVGVLQGPGVGCKE